MDVVNVEWWLVAFGVVEIVFKIPVGNVEVVDVESVKVVVTVVVTVVGDGCDGGWRVESNSKMVAPVHGGPPSARRMV